jgi:hypothetical protein
MEYLELHNEPKAEVHPEHLLTGRGGKGGGGKGEGTKGGGEGKGKCCPIKC